MTDMPTAPAHAKPARHDHLWVLFVIAACVLAEVWASWVGIGSISGFPKVGRIPTDWVLAVAMEAYWWYALYAWLVASPGPRSRAMAMWSCAAVFALSLTGQVLYHEITAPAGTTPGRRVVIGFVTSLPVIVLALIAVLIHMRHLDRADAVTAEQESAAVRELAVVRAEFDAERAALQPLRDALAAVEAARDEAAAKAETLTQKLAATARKRRPSTGRKSARATARKPEPVTGSGTASEADGVTALDEAPADLDSEARVLWYLDKGYSASRAGIAAGLTDSRGRQIARLAAAAPKGQDPEETS